MGRNAKTKSRYPDDIASKQNKNKMLTVSTNIWQKHQHTFFHHYQIQSHFSNPPRTTSVILDLRRGGVYSGSHWRQFHWIVHHIPEWCNENFDPWVGVWCWMRRSKRPIWYSLSHYIPICSRNLHAENSSPVQISELVWQLRHAHQIQLETCQTGYLWRQNTLQLNSICAKDVLLEHKIRLRKWIRLWFWRISQSLYSISILQLDSGNRDKLTRSSFHSLH